MNPKLKNRKLQFINASMLSAKLKTAIVGVCIAALASGLCHANSFFDDFNRPDSLIVGNGWSDATDDMLGSLQIKNNVVTPTQQPQGVQGIAAGIYRPMSLTSPVTISGDVTETSGFSGLSRRYVDGFGILSDGSIGSSYGVQLARGDQNYSDSRVYLYENNAYLGMVFSPFQYGPQVHVELTFSPDGSIVGVISEGTDVFNFSFGPHPLVETGGNVIWWTGYPDTQSTSSPTYSTLDNFSMSDSSTVSTPESTPTWLLLAAMAVLLIFWSRYSLSA